MILQLTANLKKTMDKTGI